MVQSHLSCHLKWQQCLDNNSKARDTASYWAKHWLNGLWVMRLEWWWWYRWGTDGSSNLTVSCLSVDLFLFVQGRDSANAEKTNCLWMRKSNLERSQRQMCVHLGSLSSCILFCCLWAFVLYFSAMGMAGLTHGCLRVLKDVIFHMYYLKSYTQLSLRPLTITPRRGHWLCQKGLHAPAILKTFFFFCFPPTPNSFSSDSHQSVLCTYKSVLILFVHLFFSL